MELVESLSKRDPWLLVAPEVLTGFIFADFYDFSYTARPSPHWQTIGNYSSQESTEKGYNEKYNVDQVPEDSVTVS